MKKVLITTESLTIGGVETALISLLDFLSKCNVEVDLFCLEKGALEDEFLKRTNVNIIPVSIPKNRIIYLIKKSLCVKSLLKKYSKIHNKKYDVAIAYYGLNNYSDLFAAAANASKKYIWVHYNFYEHLKISNKKFLMKLRNKFLKSKFVHFDKIVPVSISGEEGFKKVFSGFDEKLFVINNLIDVNSIRNKALEKNVKLSGSKKLVYSGRLEEYKRVDKLICEFAKAKKHLKDIKLYIIGDGSAKKDLEELVNKLNLKKDVIFLGFLKNPYPYINTADIVVSASSSETYSIAILEALTLKKYFISAHNSGADDAFYNTNNGNEKNGVVCDLNEINNYIIKYFENSDSLVPDFDILKENKKITKKIKNLLDIKEKTK